MLRIRVSPFEVDCVNMFLHQCHQVKLLQLLCLKMKVIFILAAEFGRLSSPKVHLFNHSSVVSFLFLSYFSKLPAYIL